MANNSPGNARNAAPRGTAPAAGRRIFLAILAAIVVIGGGTLLYVSQHPTTGPSTEALAQARDLQAKLGNAGPPQPYTLGNANAPVVIEEFADFECPSCGRFATITEPDVRKNIVLAGLAYYKYYDFPLPMHHNTESASNAAACASDQGKFWEMHDQLFGGQDAWGLTSNETEAVSDPKSIFLGYATAIGLDTSKWQSCYDSRTHQARVDANNAEALRRQVAETPTFFVNGKPLVGAVSFDVLKKAVDDAAKSPASPAAPASTAPASAAPTSH